MNLPSDYELIETYINRRGNSCVKIKHITCGTITSRLEKDLYKLCVNKKCATELRATKLKETVTNTWKNRTSEEKESIVKNRESTMIEKYGVKTNLLLPETRKNSNTSNKSKTKIKSIQEIKLKRYGTSGFNNPEKIKQTCLEKYGVDNALKTIDRKKLRSENLKTFIPGKFAWLNSYGIEPLFDISTYTVSTAFYNFKCLTCSTEFNASLENGKPPKCPTCFKKLKRGFRSKIEIEIYDWLKSESIEVKSNKKYFFGKYKFYELDFLIGNIGIELNGIYYHSEIAGAKSKNYHLDKMNFFKDNGITVLNFYDNEWITQKEIVKSIIRSKLNLNQKIMARKCSLKEISSSEAGLFLDSNHLQGHKTGINVGLYSEESLVAVMTFGKCRFDKTHEYELLRFASVKGVTVVGGFSKCLSYFVKTHSSNIVTYADQRISTGGVYEINGFKLSHVSTPNYFYTKNYKLLESRIKYQKHKLTSMKGYDVNLSEFEIMKLNGYDRIWDCGNLVYSYFHSK